MVFTPATWITLSRSLAIPVIFWALQEFTVAHRWWSLGIFLAAAATDWLDGYVARRWQQVSDLGKIIDPLVDKLLVLGALLALVQAGQVPAWGTFLILARELVIAGWRARSPVVTGANLGAKLKTGLQITAVALLLAPWPGGLGPQVVFWLAVVWTWVSGAVYLRSIN